MLFFLLPVGVDYRTERLPIVTFSLMGSCVLIHLWSMILWFTSMDSYEWWLHTFWLAPATLKPYQFVTTLFVHADIFHLLGNMIYLFLFGACVEDLLGRGRFLFLYLLFRAYPDVSRPFQLAHSPGRRFRSDLDLHGCVSRPDAQKPD